VLLAVLDALLGTALGLLLSAFARTEFQAVQFLPGGDPAAAAAVRAVRAARAMAAPLQVAVRRFPLTYAVDGMQRVRAPGRDRRGLRPRVVTAASSLRRLGSVTLPRRYGDVPPRPPAGPGQRHREAILGRAKLRRGSPARRSAASAGQPASIRAGSPLLRHQGGAVRRRARAADGPGSPFSRACSHRAWTASASGWRTLLSIWDATPGQGPMLALLRQRGLSDEAGGRRPCATS
jgi:hypothetical protein